jgi:hypothetical protein
MSTHFRKSLEDHLPLVRNGQTMPFAHSSKIAGCVLAVHLNNLYCLITIIKLSSKPAKVSRYKAKGPEPIGSGPSTGLKL